MAARKTSKTVDELPTDLAAEVERAVRAAGALPRAKLTKVKLGPKAAGELTSALVAAGLEATPKAVRVPLGAQLAALLAGGARLPLKDAPKRVKGAASKKELDAALDRLLRDGGARLVVRTQVEVLVGAAERALAATEVAALGKAHAALAKVLKKVAAKGRPRSLLRADLAELLAPATAALAPPPVPAGDDADALDADALVAEALARLEHPTLKLVRVPELVRELAARLPLAQIHAALLAAVAAGALELRPEAGGEFLRDDDARLCPPGPRGTVFSYARRVSR
jgi:hypothetical protein